MKIYNKYIVLAAMALTFAACTQEDDFTPQTDGDAVMINATIGKLQTRVAYEDDGTTNFINGDEICVQNILRESKNIATYTFDGSTWTTTDVLVWNGGTTENQFQAWYPATASFDKFTLPIDQNSIEELPAADWMTASISAMVKPDDKTINLAFEHKLAKITVQITEFTSQFGDDPCLYGATIYSLSDEYVTVNGGIKPIVRSNSAIAIVCPGKYAPGSKLMEITISEATGETYLDVPVNAFLTDTGLEAGKHYTFSLKVGKDVISINKVYVEPWTEEVINGAVADNVSTYTYFPDRHAFYVFKSESFYDAIEQAEYSTSKSNPATVKLMADIKLDDELLVPRGRIILDLNGHVITASDDAECVIRVTGSDFIIDDTSAGKQGKIVGGLNCKNIVHYETTWGDKYTINNGTFQGSANTVSVIECTQAGALIINGGTFVGGTYSVKAEADNISIAGGNFVGATYDLSIGNKIGCISYNAETGQGATFYDGVQLHGECTLKNLMSADAGYFDADGAQITVTDEQTSIEGTVTVKRIPATE